MQPCELVILISTMACRIAEGRSADEIALISSIFSQLGDTLSTISAYQDLCCNNDEEKKHQLMKFAEIKGGFRNTRSIKKGVLFP